ncbi:MAG: N-acetylmuramoyl-L-alanine amidase [Rhizomicrobium sp.]
MTIILGAVGLAGAALVTAAIGADPDAAKAGDDLISHILKDDRPNPVPPPAAKPLAAKPSAGPVPIVMSARIGEHADRTRFVVEMSDPVQMRVFTLANPDRVVIDMPAVQWHLDGPPRPTGNGAVKSYRYGLFRSGNSRFVIDLNKPMKAGDPLVLPPSGGYGYRVVIDLFPATPDQFEHNSGWPADLKAREAAAEQLAALPPAPAPVLEQKRIVVIDAGHGGIDSGTSGVNGLMEKDLVLDEALRLGRELARRGYTVHLTRDTDVFIPLRERVSIARSWHADLFISLHADSNPDPNVNGLSIYTLSDSGSDREAAALARKENQSDVIAGVDLGGGNSTVAPILIDLAQRDTMNRSSRFATGAVSLLTGATDILPRQPHRSAGFVVLKAPDVPAVLVELGYLSNAGDADQMNTVRWRTGVANALASAVEGYFRGGTP